MSYILAHNLTHVFGPWARPCEVNWPMIYHCTSTGLEESIELRMEKFHPARADISVPQSLYPVVIRFDKFWPMCIYWKLIWACDLIRIHPSYIVHNKINLENYDQYCTCWLPTRSSVATVMTTLGLCTYISLPHYAWAFLWIVTI